MSVLQIQNIAKEFGKTSVLVNLSLGVKSGEFIVVLGASGCGKSTLLNIIAGLETPTSGQILLDDNDITHADPAKRDIAFVFQSYALYPHLNVYDNISFSLKLRKTTKAEMDRRVLEVAEKLQLENLLNRMPSQLSGGQRQRVAMGRAIIRKPKVFLFDEPLSNLDVALRIRMRMELLSLHRNQHAISVYVTHDQHEAMTMADRIIVMNQGRVEQMGTPADIYNKPANLFVAEFIGYPKINLFRPERLGKRPSDLPSDATVAVRPEHMHLALPEIAPPEDALPLECDFLRTEYPGGEYIYYFEHQNQLISLKSHHTLGRIEKHATLYFHTSDMLVF